MSNTNRDYILSCDLKNSNIVVKRPMKFFTTDRNTANVFIKLVNSVVTDEDLVTYVDIEDMENVEVDVHIIKPNKELVTLHAVLLLEEQIFRLDLPQNCTDMKGSYLCELVIRSTVSDILEVNTSNSFDYNVQGSILDNLGDVTDIEVNQLEQLIMRIEALENAINK